MVSKYEVLEYLKGKGKVPAKELDLVFRIRGNMKGLGWVLQDLERQGYIKRYWRELIFLGKISTPFKEVWIPVKKPTRGRKVWVELTPYAYRVLKKNKVDSFLEMRMAKFFKAIKLKRDWLI